MVGSIEILTASNESMGYPGASLTKEAVPVIVGALAGVTGLEEVAATKRPSGRTPDAQWTGVDAQGQSVTVMLWPQAPEPPVFANPEDEG